MPASDACPHGYPSPKSCMTCLEDVGVGPDPAAPLTVEATFTARFDGLANCAGCNLPIREGQRIAKMSNETYRHSGCT